MTELYTQTCLEVNTPQEQSTKDPGLLIPFWMHSRFYPRLGAGNIKDEHAMSESHEVHKNPKKQRSIFKGHA